MATLTVNPDADPETSSVDGVTWEAHNGGVPGNGVTWGALRAGPGNQANDSITSFWLEFGNHSDVDKWYKIGRPIIVFDITGVPSGVTITAVTLSLYLLSKLDQLGIAANFKGQVYSASPASDVALVAGDFNSFGATAWSDAGLPYNSATTNQYNGIVLNAAGIAAVQAAFDDDGIVRLMLREEYYDVGNVIPTWVAGFNNETQFRFRSAEDSLNLPPKLVVTFPSFATAGFIWVDGRKIYYGDANNEKRQIEGTDTGTNAEAGHLFVEGTYCHYLDESGDERRQQGTKLGATGKEAGHFHVEGSELHYIDANGDERYLPVGAGMGASIFNRVLFNG